MDVGHLLGSSSIEIWVTEDGSTTKLVFSGDIGNINQPLIKDPAYITDADYVAVSYTHLDVYKRQPQRPPSPASRPG